MRLYTPSIILMLGLLSSAACHADPALDYLKKVMDQYHQRYDVYSDVGAAGNHFVTWMRMSSYDAFNRERKGTFSQSHVTTHVPKIEHEWKSEHPGVPDFTPDGSLSCIKAQFIPEEMTNSIFSWGGWYFQHGVHKGGNDGPLPNWGDQAGAGVNLSDATKLTFWVKGATGKERVEFFVFGVGWDADARKWYGIDQPAMEDLVTGKRFEHKESSPKASTGCITLSREWERHTINMRSLNRSYVLGGFGWAASSTENGLRSEVTFYLDGISYNKPRLDEPRFLVSYEALPPSFPAYNVLGGAAHTYDNALALMAFLAMGERKRAGLIANAFVEAQMHDRTYRGTHRLAGAVRNVYTGGDLFQPPGWGKHKDHEVRLHGWQDERSGKWLEDPYNVSFSSGNVAWCMLALLAYHDMVARESTDAYLNTAIKMGEWVERNCKDPRGKPGYIFGHQGSDPSPSPVFNKATEHNIDLYAAFMRLHLVTGNFAWAERAESAKRFVLGMWDAKNGKFWTGTGPDGRTDTEKLPLDIQAWAVLSLRGELGDRNPLPYASEHFRVDDGFDFNDDCDGIWYEGTAQMAAAYYQQGGKEGKTEWKRIMQVLTQAQARFNKSGALPAAEPKEGDFISTGFTLMGSNKPWRYYNHAHVGATAWMILAKKGINPFWMGSEK